MLVHIVADYGHGDLAFADVVQHIRLHLPDELAALLHDFAAALPDRDRWHRARP